MIYTMNIIIFWWDYPFNSKYEAVHSGEPPQLHCSIQAGFTSHIVSVVFSYNFLNYFLTKKKKRSQRSRKKKQVNWIMSPYREIIENPLMRNSWYHYSFPLFRLKKSTKIVVSFHK